MRIYIDMDDTLVHFREWAVNNGVPRWEGSWYTTDRATWTPEQCFIQDRTNDLMRAEAFWATMPLVDGAHALISAASFRGEVFLLTALPSALVDEPLALDMVRRTKVQYAWQKLHVPPERVIVCNRADKVRYAYDHFNNCQNLLIDDAEQTCREWQLANGITCHVPNVDNGLGDAIDFVKCL